mmetsp:Transcript_17331/g.37835  ORF Transcript_17331/g.37835 Transcript_17331/m.37835 type:complete len:329 (+) Transcript_17331:1566-2552(+)
MSDRHVPVHLMHHVTNELVKLVHPVPIHATPFASDRGQKGGHKEGGQMSAAAVFHFGSVVVVVVITSGDLWIVIVVDIILSVVVGRVLIVVVIIFFFLSAVHNPLNDHITIIIVTIVGLVHFFSFFFFFLIFRITTIAIIIAIVQIQIGLRGVLVFLLRPGQAPNQICQVPRQFGLHRHLIAQVQTVPQSLPQLQQIEFGQARAGSIVVVIVITTITTILTTILTTAIIIIPRLQSTPRLQILAQLPDGRVPRSNVRTGQQSTKAKFRAVPIILVVGLGVVVVVVVVNLGIQPRHSDVGLGPGFGRGQARLLGPFLGLVDLFQPLAAG